MDFILQLTCQFVFFLEQNKMASSLTRRNPMKDRLQLSSQNFRSDMT